MIFSTLKSKLLCRYPLNAIPRLEASKMSWKTGFPRPNTQLYNYSSAKCTIPADFLSTYHGVADYSMIEIDRALYIYVYMYKIWCDHERSFRLLCTYHVYANIYMRKWTYKSCMYSNLYDIRATLLICCHKLVDKLLHHMKSRGNQFHDEISLKCQAVPWKSKLLRGNPSCAKFSYG